MTNITLRSVKGSPLTNDEVDSNFSSLNNYKVEQSDSTGSALIPSGTTAQRDGSPSAGMIRYNTDLSRFEGYITSWEKISISKLDSAGVSSIISADVDATFINDLTIDADTLGGQNSAYHLNYNNFTNIPTIPSLGTDYVDSAQARLLFSVTDAGGDGSLAYNNTTGVYTYTGPSASEVRAHFTASTGISISSGAISSNDGEIVHDNLSGFVADEHVAHTGVTLTAGNGLTGGGDISTSRSFAVGAGTGITVTADAVSTNDAQIDHDALSNFVSNEHIDHTSVTLTAGIGLKGGGDISTGRTFEIDSAQLYSYFDHDAFNDFVANEHIDHSGVTITAGSGLTGGGDITATRTLNIGAGTGITVTADAVSTNDAQIVHDNLSGFVADEHVAHSGVTLTAGAGLTGGGTIAASRSFAVGAGTGVTVNADDVAIGQDVATTADVNFATVTTTGNVTVGGNLQVDGTTVTVNATDLSVTDNMIYLNAGESAGSPTLSIDVGWAANVNDDGSYAHVGLFRDATDNTFKVFEGYTPEPDAAVQINTGHASFSLAPFSARTLTGKYLGADSDIDARLSGGTGISYSSGVISTNDAQIVHDNLSGFVADEHVAHSGVTLTAGAGLTGGGTIASSRTFNIGAGTGITVNANDIQTNDAQIVHDNLSGFVADEHVAHSGVTLTAGNGLTGGGTIAASRSFAVGAGTGITVTADAVSTNDGEIVHDNLSGFVADEHIAHSGVTLTAGFGLSGGGTIAASRTFNIDSAELYSYFDHDAFNDFVANEHIDHSGVTLTAGTGLSGGGDITASRTFNLDFSELTDMTGDISGTTEFILQNGAVESRKAASEIKLSAFNNDAGWTANTGDITGVTAGVGLSGGGTSGGVTLTVDLSELTDMTAAVVGAQDELILLDNGADRRKLISEINLGQFNNDQSWTSNAGTVTSVGGTGTVSGLTLTGTVTSSGNLTLGGTLSNVTSSNFSSTTTLLIKNSAGTTLKTIRSPSS